MPYPEQRDNFDGEDEARVGTLGLDGQLSARDVRYRLLPILKSHIASAGRRPRRTLYLLFPLFVLLTWMGLNYPLRLADVTTISNWGFNSSSSGLATSHDGRVLRQGLVDCLSLKQCSWFDIASTRAQLLKADEEYLDSEHLALPRMLEPYPDINNWSMEKKARTMSGLDWLLAHYDERWRPLPVWKSARSFNQAIFTRLRHCLELSMSPSKFGARTRLDSEGKPLTCSREEMTVILLGSRNFGTVHTGSVSGENIWARSVMDAFNELGYSSLYAFDQAEIYDIHRAIPDLVQIVIAEANSIRACYEFGRPQWSQALSEDDIKQGPLVLYIQAEAKESHQTRNHTLDEWTKLQDGNQVDRWQNPVFYGHRRLHGQIFSNAPDALSPDSPNFEPHQEWRCAQAPDFPQGIPLWKMFAFHFWASTHEHPLGPQWTLSPEPYATFPALSGDKDYNMYTGYSIEAYCGDVVPLEERKNRAYILTKKSEYLSSPAFAFSEHIFSDLKEEMGFDFVAGIGERGSALPDPAIINLGFLTLADFQRELGRSKAVVGVGRPFLSPTPYDALCMGVPFINPIIAWSKENPDDTGRWRFQHEGLAELGEPYVYNVKNGNETQLKTALAKAFANPIERFVPRRMTKAAMRARHRLLVEADWKAVYEERYSGNQG